MKKSKEITGHKSEAEVADFWQAHDSTEYVDWETGEFIDTPKLKPSTQTISLRLPVSLLNDIRMMANKKDVPYQSLIKVFLSDRVEQERARVFSGV